MIAYHETKTGLAVYLEGRKVGTIKRDKNNLWFYLPNGQRAKDVPASEKSPYLKTITSYIEKGE